MLDYKKFILYAFYDELKVFIAVIKKDTPTYIVERIKLDYDEVRFE